MMIYDRSIFYDICAEISKGAYLKAICERDGMPSLSTVYRWFDQSEEAREMYARARQERADVWADEIVHIADTDDDPQRARVRVDARKWAAAKGNPKRYSDRHVVAGDPEQPVEHRHNVSGEAVSKLAALLEGKSARD